MRELTSDDEGKRVVVDDEPVGTVREVENADTAIVDPEPDLGDAIRSRLSWESDQDTYRIRNASVDAVTDDEVRLQPD